jgi:tRNA(adenine34) deaminase
MSRGGLIDFLQKKAAADDERWMKAALKEAEKAFESGEVPVGAVVVYENRIIGRGHNQTEGLKDPTAHAEIIAIGAAASFLNSWRLSDCSLYVTLEPCAMCAGAIVLARLDRLIFGPHDQKAGACGSLMNIVQDGRLNHQVSITSEVLTEECSVLLKSFFHKLRKESDSTSV